ncbi:hypothetical protein WA158_001687 [Blastocystis sp. Blastoise]
MESATWEERINRDDSNPIANKYSSRAIFTPPDFNQFLKSESYQNFVQFILKCNDAVVGKKISSVKSESKTILEFIKILEEMYEWVNEIPPIQQRSRFGNKAYRIWNARLLANSESLIKRLIPNETEEHIGEIASYLNDAFGNQTRIDYGTGHETTFFIVQYCLYKLGAYKDEDLSSIVLLVYNQYLKVVRYVQRTYWLEPAGSHGVWSLDDYQMLCFFFGASQLINDPLLDPSCVNNKDVVDQYADDYLYLGAIQFILKCKTGPFYEHSPMLYNISGTKTWIKVNQGMFKMWKTEVLGKFPVVQHIRFGEIFPKSWEPSRDPHGREYGYVKPPTEP